MAAEAMISALTTPMIWWARLVSRIAQTGASSSGCSCDHELK